MKKAILLILVIIGFSSNIEAHPGRTASDGCHYCRTRCDYWGVPWDTRHCHGGAGGLLNQLSDCAKENKKSKFRKKIKKPGLFKRVPVTED